MTLAEIEAAVQILTNRDDFAGPGGKIEVMVQAATLRMHQVDFFERDVAEQLLNLGTPMFVGSFDAIASFTRYRAIKYLRKYDLPTDTKGKMLDKVDVDNLFDQYGIEKTDRYYVAGNNIVFRSSTSQQYFNAGWYQNPDITVATYSSWIAALVPHAIIFDACSLVFQMTGQQDQSRKFDGLVQEQLMMVRQHGIQGKGY